MFHSRSLLTLLLFASLSMGCGAKTGLPVPDAQVSDGDGGLPVPEAGLPCIELDFEAGPVDVDLETEAQVGSADVVFLIDTTASMGDELAQIRRQLRDVLVPAIRAEIPDAQLGVATLGDFPVIPFGNPGSDLPFELLLPMTNDISRAQATVNSIRLRDGLDEPESQVEALYQLATGAGLGAFIPASSGCPAGGFGYPCFRRDAFPVVLLFTDASFHNGPEGEDAYDEEPAGRTLSPAPHRYDEMVAELDRNDIRVIGFDSGDTRGHLEAIARDTGAVDGEGEPLVFRIGRRGERLGVGVVDAIRTFAGTAVFDVDVLPLDGDRSDGVDAREFVEAITPVEARPADGVESIDVEGGRFLGVRAGTRLFYSITLRNDLVEPGPLPQRFLLRLVFRADGRSQLGSRLIEIVVPALDGTGC